MTFETPLKYLQPFVRAVLTEVEPPLAASATIDHVVFEPRALLDLLTKNSIFPSSKRGCLHTAKEPSEVRELLRWILSERIDFLFVMDPLSFAIYAGYDEFKNLLCADALDVG